MTRRPRLRLTLPPLSPREALTLSCILSAIDDLLWLRYGEAMAERLTQKPATRWLARGDPSSLKHGRPNAR